MSKKTNKFGNYKIGRPIKFSYSKRLEILKDLIEYIDKTEYPTIPNFCKIHKIHKQRIYEFAEDNALNEDCVGKHSLAPYFSDCIARINNNQEAYIENKAIENDISPTFAMYKLNQLGWNNKKEDDANTEIIKLLIEKNNILKQAIENVDI